MNEKEKITRRMHRLKRISAIKLAAVSGFLDVGVSAGYFFAAIMFSRSVSGPGLIFVWNHARAKGITGLLVMTRSIRILALVARSWFTDSSSFCLGFGFGFCFCFSLGSFSLLFSTFLPLSQVSADGLITIGNHRNVGRFDRVNLLVLNLETFQFQTEVFFCFVLLAHQVRLLLLALFKTAFLTHFSLFDRKPSQKHAIQKWRFPYHV